MFKGGRVLIGMRPLLWVLSQDPMEKNVGDAFCHFPE